MIPQEVCAVLQTLEHAGHEAYAVGGCVRDILMGKAPHDWDVTTSALPQETMALFNHFAIPTGLQHGTVTVRSGALTCEVTTFRTDGDYPDHRHPAAVTFTRSLREDLARRDLTVNAMAMDMRGTLHDPFDGQADIRRRILRCVGQPEHRFREDALRILRTLRFSATLGFMIEEDTHQAQVAALGPQGLVRRPAVCGGGEGAGGADEAAVRHGRTACPAGGSAGIGRGAAGDTALRGL